ncbi:hypothetical protein SISSUDRAFT_1127453 [Sistotremastrum suecicum HHB10207 ss-3]|uniref:Uncharacterized protein n=1 Tax=Sistotremastrum suecicum HHB10207 ss-3 TaxID=1314776 RepID=A0A166F0P0_9AGAM|nr:hypothetical protein SISSUDRAFT_1127453 [Sistotremastrum suecicum HHB10207 ss-3]
MSIASRNDKVTNKTESVMGPAQSSSEISLKRSTSDPEKVPSSETPDEVHSLPKRLIKSGGFVWKKFKAGPERFFQPNDSSFNPPPGKSPRTSPEPILDISPAEETGPGHAVLEHIDAPTILLAPPQRPDLPSLSNDQALPHYPLEPRSESSKQGNTRTRPWRTTKTDFPATDLPDSQFFFTLVGVPTLNYQACA